MSFFTFSLWLFLTKIDFDFELFSIDMAPPLLGLPPTVVIPRTFLDELAEEISVPFPI